MSRYSTRKSFDLEWVEHWARRVNEDRMLAVIGRFFTGKFVLGIDDNDYLIEVSKGKIQRIAEGLNANDFGFDLDEEGHPIEEVSVEPRRGGSLADAATQQPTDAKEEEAALVQ